MKIPKSTNELVFFLAILGIVFFFSDRHYRSIVYWFVMSIFLFMLSWRSVFKIESSRYAAGMIYPVSFFAVLFLNSMIKRRGLFPKALTIVLLIALLLNWTNKTYINAMNSSHLDVISQLHDRYNKKGSSRLYTGIELLRIKRMEKNSNPFKYSPLMKNNDLSSFAKDYITVGEIALVDISSNDSEFDNRKIISNSSKVRRILSIQTQKNRKKRHNVFKVESEAKLYTLSMNQSIPPESGILSNGDLEIIDSREQSLSKSKSILPENESLQNIDFRTPYNAYFFNSPLYNKFSPYYNCLNDKAISGKNSARIRSSQGWAYLFFYQRFFRGIYNYSVMFKGETGTQVELIYDIYKDSTWTPISLARYTLKDKGIHKIEVVFNASDLEPDVFFLLGAFVCNGEAYLDNFCVTQEKE